MNVGAGRPADAEDAEVSEYHHNEWTLTWRVGELRLGAPPRFSVNERTKCRLKAGKARLKVAYEINWDNVTWAYREWSESDKARLAGMLFFEVDPTPENCRAFVDEAGDSNCEGLAKRIHEVYGGGGPTGKE